MFKGFVFLKVTTTVAFVGGLISLLVTPWVVRKPGVGASPRDLSLYGAAGLAWFAFISILFLTAAICAIILGRRHVAEFEAQRAKNLSELIKGSLNDHDRRS